MVIGFLVVLSDSFILGVFRWGLNWGGRGSVGDILFFKSVRVNFAVYGLGVEV